MVAVLDFVANDQVYQASDDFSEYAAVNKQLDFTEKTVEADDIVAVFKVNKGMKVLGILWDVETLEGTGPTGTVGDTADPNGFEGALDTSAANQGRTLEADAYGTTPRLYEEDDTIDFIPATTGLSVGKINFQMLVCRVPLS